MFAWYSDNVVSDDGTQLFQKEQVHYLGPATVLACKSFRVTPPLHETLAYTSYTNPVIVRYEKTFGILPLIALEIPRQVRKVKGNYEVKYKNDEAQLWLPVKKTEEIYLYEYEKK